MNQAKFNEDVHSSFKNIFIEYMTDVEAYYLEVEKKPYTKEIEDRVIEFRQTYSSNIKKRLRLYLDDINGSQISDEQKLEASETLYRNESAFNSDAVLLGINIKNRFGKAPE